MQVKLYKSNLQYMIEQMEKYEADTIKLDIEVDTWGVVTGVDFDLHDKEDIFIATAISKQGGEEEC